MNEKDTNQGGYEAAYLSDALRANMKRNGKRFWAGDNISEYVDTDDKKHRSRLLEA